MHGLIPMVSDFEEECSGECDDVEKSGREERTEGGKVGVGGETRWNRWRSCEISAAPGLMWAHRTYASRKCVSGFLDHSVNCCAFFTTKTVLGC
jgi:hypothetical protein